MDRRICVLRVVACFLVILLHVSAENIHVFSEKWWSANVYDSLARSCVPLFIMIAGATLLSKEETLGAFLGKRFIRIIPPLIFWSAFYLWWLQYNGVAVGNWVMAILAGPTMFHLWYFYALIGLYAVVPILRKFYQHSTRNEQMWFIALWFLVASVYPTLRSLQASKDCGYLQLGPLAETYHLTYFSGYIGFLLLGAFLAQGKGSVRVGLSIFFLASTSTMAATYWVSKRLGTPCEFFYLYLSPLVIFAALGLFMAAIGLRSGPPSRMLRTLSDCSLGIYCLHVFIIDPVFKRGEISATLGNPWISSLTTSVGVFLFAFVVIYVFRKIPFFRYVS